MKRKSTPPYMVVGRHQSAPAQNSGLDFILPDVPWFQMYPAELLRQNGNDKPCGGAELRHGDL